MKVYDDEGFYFDRIYLLSRRSSREIMIDFPINEYRQYCRSFEIVNTDKDRGFNRSRIMVVAPTSDFLSMLLENEDLLGDGYLISYLEIAHDQFCDSRMDAELKARNLFKTLRKKFSFGTVYKDRKEKTWKDRVKDKQRGLFTDRTFYSCVLKQNNTKKVPFKHVVYARYSKINWMPCVHSEWRIAGAGLIARKTGIRNIRDLVDFDIMNFFAATDKKYVVREEIDHERLGRWLRGIDGRRKLKTIRERAKVSIPAMHFIYGNKIKNYLGLVAHLKGKQERIASKRGPRSAYDEKIMALKDFSIFRRGIDD